MIDFPSSPTTGQIFSAAGASWRYDGTKWVAYGGGSSGDIGRNLIHNPLMAIAQRGAGPWTTVGSYTADRWGITFAGGTSSATLITLTDADRAAIGDESAGTALQNVYTGTAGAGDFTWVAYQPIEGLRRLAGKTLTWSFWARAAAGTPKLGLNLYQNVGTGGSPSGSGYATAQSVTLSTTWTRYVSASFAMPSASGKVLGTNNNDYTHLLFWGSSGTTNNTNAGSIGVQSATIQLWGVQLEIGSAATPLEKLNPRQDLANCLRFYQVLTAVSLGGYHTAGGNIDAPVMFPVYMRATPTVTYTGTGYTNGSGFGLINITAGGAAVRTTVTATGAMSAFGNCLLAADL